MKRINRRAKTILMTIYLLAAAILTIAATGTAFARDVIGIEFIP